MVPGSSSTGCRVCSLLTSTAGAGSLAPEILLAYIRDRTDVNYNGVEDHTDYINVGGRDRIQTQSNVWNTEAGSK